MTDIEETQFLLECAKRWRKMGFHILASMAESTARGDMTNLDMKNGVPFEAATEYLYQKKIEELEAEMKALKTELEYVWGGMHYEYCDDSCPGLDKHIQEKWIKFEKARQTLKDAGLET